MLRLKRTETFAASHRLYNPKWSDEKNKDVFGKCSHPHGHGHNYKLEVCVCGPIHKDTGMIYNLSILKELIQDTILVHVDHRNLNIDVPWLKDKIPTTENLVEGIWEELENACQKNGAILHSITVWETEKNCVVKEHQCKGK